MDVAPEFVEISALHPEGADEVGVHLRQHPLLHLAGFDVHRRRLAGEAWRGMVLPVGDLDVARGARLHAEEAAVQIGHGMPRADLHDPVLAHASLEGLAVHRPLDVEGDPVALLGPARHLPPFPPPRAQGLDHAVDIGLPDLGGRPADLDGLEVGEPDVGKHLEDGGVPEARPGFALHRIDPRLAGGPQLLACERVCEARAQELAHHLVAHRRPEAPDHNLHRRLAGPEPRDPRGPHQVVEPRPDLALDSLLGKLDRQAALETGRGLYRDLHVFTSVPRSGIPASVVRRGAHRASRPFDHVLGDHVLAPPCGFREETGAKGEIRTLTGCPTGT